MKNSGCHIIMVNISVFMFIVVSGYIYYWYILACLSHELIKNTLQAVVICLSITLFICLFILRHQCFIIYIAVIEIDMITYIQARLSVRMDAGVKDKNTHCVYVYMRVLLNIYISAYMFARGYIYLHAWCMCVCFVCEYLSPWVSELVTE